MGVPGRVGPNGTPGAAVADRSSTWSRLGRVGWVGHRLEGGSLAAGSGRISPSEPSGESGGARGNICAQHALYDFGSFCSPPLALGRRRRRVRDDGGQDLGVKIPEGVVGPDAVEGGGQSTWAQGRRLWPADAVPNPRPDPQERVEGFHPVRQRLRGIELQHHPSFLAEHSS